MLNSTEYTCVILVNLWFLGFFFSETRDKSAYVIVRPCGALALKKMMV